MSTKVVVSIIVSMLLTVLIMIMGLKPRANTPVEVKRGRAVFDFVFYRESEATKSLSTKYAEGWDVISCRRANDGGGEYAAWGVECLLRRDVVEIPSK